MGALVWVRLERPHAFRRARDTFVVAQLMTVVVTLCLPVAPPRTLPDLGLRDLLAARTAPAARRSRIRYRARSPRCRAAT